MKPVWKIIIAVLETVIDVVKSIFDKPDTPALNG
jgi:hypothetical protein